MGATKELYIKVRLKSSSGYHSQLIMQDEIDSYKPPFDCKIIGYEDISRDPNGDFHYYETENESYTNAESSIINKW